MIIIPEVFWWLLGLALLLPALAFFLFIVVILQQARRIGRE